MAPLEIAAIGAGWWGDTYQIPAWKEIRGVELKALCDRDRGRAEASAQRHGIARVYTDAEDMFRREKIDLVDIAASIDAHAPLVELAARHRIPVICQKPMAADWASCREMVRTCLDAGVPFLIHENMRWQSPVRAIKALLDKNGIGRPFRARLQYNYNAPGIYENQPYLKELRQLILPDLGSHILDTARFLFGEPSRLYAHHSRTRDDIQGEDVASVHLGFGELACSCEMSFATFTEWGDQASLAAFVEGTAGTAELLPGYWLRLTDVHGVHAWRCPPRHYSWSGPGAEAVWCASIVDCHRNLIGSLQGGAPAETSAADNLRTMNLMFKAYESAKCNQVVSIGSDATH